MGCRHSLLGSIHLSTLEMARSLPAALLLLVASMVAVASAQYEEDSVGTVFFLTNDLHPGSKMTLHFVTRPATPTATGGAIALPSADYHSIPFTSAKIPEILSRLAVPAGSPAAAAIRSTLAQCEAPPAPGVEALRCVTSYGSMADFAAASLGTRDVRAARTRLIAGRKGRGVDGAATPRQAYEVESVAPVPVAGGDMVACHRLPYPYDVFACHTTTAAVYAVSLAGADDGTTRAEALAACHADAFPGISRQAYDKLGVEPGSAPVCHFLPQDSTLWMRNY